MLKGKFRHGHTVGHAFNLGYAYLVVLFTAMVAYTLYTLDSSLTSGPWQIMLKVFPLFSHFPPIFLLFYLFCWR